MRVVTAFSAALLLSFCAPRAELLRSDGSAVVGALNAATEDAYVMGRAMLMAPEHRPAPFNNDRGEPSWTGHVDRVVVPREDVVHIRSTNGHARRAGIAGAVLTPLGLVALIPSAIARADCTGGSIFGCIGEDTGVVVGATLLVAGVAALVTGWVVYAQDERDEPGVALLRDDACPPGKACVVTGLDADGDGLLDSVDRCPTIPGDRGHAGCKEGLDTDGDGLLDEYDRCPLRPPTGVGVAGCPADLDSDGDGLLDMYDKCPAHRAAQGTLGCPPTLDSDGDGLLDVDDRCPLHAPDAAGKLGCPSVQDSDRDSLLDTYDRCPLVKQSEGGARGCPPALDSDGDGVPDMSDDCLAAAEDRRPPRPADGCPGTRLDVKGCRLKLATSVFFEVGKATLRKRARRAILQVARELRRLETLEKVVVEGHTDSAGASATNLTLSRQRAASVADALRAIRLLDGVPIEATGRGEDTPVAPNDTASGRAKNRRVEFRVVDAACR